MKDTMIKYLVVTTFSIVEFAFVVALYSATNPDYRNYCLIYYFISKINFSLLKG